MANKINLAIGSIITLMLAMSGVYYVSDGDNAYFCEVKDMVMLCEN